MIITCPKCGRKFMLKHKPGRTFTCPKCSYRTAFNLVLNGAGNVSEKVTNTESVTTPTTLNEKTTLDVPAGGATMPDIPKSGGEKTQLVEGLQKPRPARLLLSFCGQSFGEKVLPATGQFTLGRNSIDSVAQIRLTPDKAMSRVHAGMRVVEKNGVLSYQITTIKDSNPVFVNSIPIRKGQPVTLRQGDTIRMGETTAIFHSK